MEERGGQWWGVHITIGWMYMKMFLWHLPRFGFGLKVWRSGLVWSRTRACRGQLHLFLCCVSWICFNLILLGFGGCFEFWASFQKRAEERVRKQALGEPVVPMDSFVLKKLLVFCSCWMLWLFVIGCCFCYFSLFLLLVYDPSWTICFLVDGWWNFVVVGNGWVSGKYSGKILWTSSPGHSFCGHSPLLLAFKKGQSPSGIETLLRSTLCQ